MSSNDGNIKLGCVVEEIFTGVRGTVVGETRWLYGCTRVVVALYDLHNSRPVEDCVFDEKQVSYCPSKGNPLYPKKYKSYSEREVDFNKGIRIGSKAKDKVTGFSGIVIAKTEWLFGGVRLTIKPDYLNDKGETLDAQTFDEPQLDLIEADVLKDVDVSQDEKVEERTPHGDGKPEPTRREIASRRD